MNRRPKPKRKVELWTPPTLAPGDSWTYTCGTCGTWLQGGRSAVDAHSRVVHPPAPFRRLA